MQCQEQLFRNGASSLILAYMYWGLGKGEPLGNVHLLSTLLAYRIQPTSLSKVKINLGMLYKPWHSHVAKAAAQHVWRCGHRDVSCRLLLYPFHYTHTPPPRFKLLLFLLLYLWISCKLGRTKGQELNLVACHILTIPIWKNSYYCLYYPVLLFAIYLLNRIQLMFSHLKPIVNSSFNGIYLIIKILFTIMKEMYG